MFRAGERRLAGFFIGGHESIFVNLEEDYEMKFAIAAIKFFTELKKPENLPEGIVAMNPYEDPKVMKYVAAFFKKFYNDHNKRIFILGINPGRFGAGVTGIPFTDPVKLREKLGIENDLGDFKEFSADFIYRVIDGYGGPTRFFSRFYINSMSPLGYTKNGRNYNYYDDPVLLKLLEEYIAGNIWKQVKMGAERENVICLGTGTNYKFFSKFNAKHRFFERAHPVEHPRFILQYRKRYTGDYVKKYIDLLNMLSQ